MFSTLFLLWIAIGSICGISYCFSVSAQFARRVKRQNILTEIWKVNKVAFFCRLGWMICIVLSLIWTVIDLIAGFSFWVLLVHLVAVAVVALFQIIFSKLEIIYIKS
jgi:hypothetical protein